MLKYLWIYAACLWGMQLSAETVGNIEFQFPPSNYDWKILVDSQFYNDALFSREEDDFLGDEDDDEFFEENNHFKFFTHREGDALEILIVLQTPVDEDDEDEEIDTLFTAQKKIDKWLNRYLPNHRLDLLNWEELKENGFVDWELNDGQLDLMHGYVRHFKKDDDTCILFYLTTGLRTEYSRAIWIQTLNNAH